MRSVGREKLPVPFTPLLLYLVCLILLLILSVKDLHVLIFILRSDVDVFVPADDAQYEAVCECIFC